MEDASGFTLIELVVVIVLLGILSAIAIPKFVDLQRNARESAMNGLKAALETADTLIHAKAVIENKTTYADQTLSSGIEVRYGYPQAEQNDLKQIIDAEDWKLSGSGTTVTFTLKEDSDTVGLSVSAIQASSSICKLIYTQAAKGERPDISISGCTN